MLLKVAFSNVRTSLKVYLLWREIFMSLKIVVLDTQVILVMHGSHSMSYQDVIIK